MTEERIVTENPDEQATSLSHVFSRLTHTEQIRMIMTHPFFTGRCPQCRYKFQLAKTSIGNCHCPACDWKDDPLG